jgi:multicomponent Na+:H+ antiporter subunit C
MTDPLPQALMITAIVIGAAITALALMLSIKIFHYYGTLDWKELIEREG